MRVFHIKDAQDARDYEVDKMLHESREDLKRINRKYNWREWLKAYKEGKNEQAR